MNKIKKFRFIAVLMIILFAGISTVKADIIYLKNGKKVVGEIKKYMEDQVGIQVDKKYYFIPKSKIAKIVEKEYHKPEFEINWAVVITTVILTGGLFGLAIWGREL